MPRPILPFQGLRDEPGTPALQSPAFQCHPQLGVRSWPVARCWAWLDLGDTSCSRHLLVTVAHSEHRQKWVPAMQQGVRMAGTVPRSADPGGPYQISSYQRFTSRSTAAARLQLSMTTKSFYSWGSPQHENLYERAAALGRLRTTVPQGHGVRYLPLRRRPRPARLQHPLAGAPSLPAHHCPSQACWTAGGQTAGGSVLRNKRGCMRRAKFSKMVTVQPHLGQLQWPLPHVTLGSPSSRG